MSARVENEKEMSVSIVTELCGFSKGALLSAEMEVIELPSLVGPWLPASGWAS